MKFVCSIHPRLMDPARTLLISCAEHDSSERRSAAAFRDWHLCNTRFWASMTGQLAYGFFFSILMNAQLLYRCKFWTLEAPCPSILLVSDPFLISAINHLRWDHKDMTCELIIRALVYRASFFCSFNRMESCLTHCESRLGDTKWWTCQW